MLILGIESSCDDCSLAVVEDGCRIVAHTVASQVELHRPYDGVVPELASRAHTELILPTYRETLRRAGLKPGALDGVAVTSRPGLSGSLVVGVSFAKALAYGLDVPLIGIDHILAHLYAPQLEQPIEYPFLGVLVSGGHTLICKVQDFDDIEVLGTTIDDACGEAFDKVAKHLGLGYPGGVVIDRLARLGNAEAFHFPVPSLHKGDHRYDVSYSGLKTAVVNQLDQFHTPGFEKSHENIAASFEKAAVDMLVSRVLRAAKDTGLTRIVAGGGVAANSYFRSRLAETPRGRHKPAPGAGPSEYTVIFPPLELCTDNGAMVAGIGYQHIIRGDRSGLDLDVSSRVPRFRHSYP